MDRGPTPVESESRCRNSSDQSIMRPVMEFGTAVVALANRALDAASARFPANIQLVSASELVMGTTGSNNHDDRSRAFDDCLNRCEFDEMGKCQYYMDMLLFSRKHPTS